MTTQYSLSLNDSLAAALQAKAASSARTPPFALTLRTTNIEPTPAPPPSPVDFGYEAAAASPAAAAAKWRSRVNGGAAVGA